MWPFNKKLKEERNISIGITDDEGNSQISRIQDQSACTIANNELNFLQKMLTLSDFDPMSISPVFAATNMISNGIAQMPWIVKSLKGKEVPSDCYLLHLFDKSIQTRFMFIKNIVKDVLIHGNGFAYIERDKDGVPENLIYLKWGECSVYYSPITYKVYYRIPRISNGFIEDVNVVHLLMHSADGIVGNGILDFARHSLQLGAYTEKAALDYFQSGMQVQGIIKSNLPRLDKKQRNDIRNAWEDNKINGKIRVLEGGLEYQNIQSNAREAQLLDTRLFTVQEISRFFNINPVLLNDLSKTAYNTLEQAQNEFVTHTLSPYILMLEEEMNRKLVMPNDKKKFYIDIDEESIIKADRTSLANYAGSLVDKGIITRNEARKLLGYQPVEGGDKLTVSYTDVEQNTISDDNADKSKSDTLYIEQEKDKEEENE